MRYSVKTKTFKTIQECESLSWAFTYRDDANRKEKGHVVIDNLLEREIYDFSRDDMIEKLQSFVKCCGGIAVYDNANLFLDEIGKDIINEFLQDEVIEEI